MLQEGPSFGGWVESNGQVKLSAKSISAGDSGSGTATVVSCPNGARFRVVSNCNKHCNEVHFYHGASWRKGQVSALLSNGWLYAGYCEDGKKIRGAVWDKEGDIVEVYMEGHMACFCVNGRPVKLVRLPEAEQVFISVRVHNGGCVEII